MLSGFRTRDSAAREASLLARSFEPYVGYECGTFQIIEHHRGQPALIPFDDWPAPDRAWHFVFSSVLAAFTDAGLDEIDVQIYLQHRLGIRPATPGGGPRSDFAPELGPRPAGLLAVPGDEMVAFSLEVAGRGRIGDARRWLNEVFLPRWVDPIAQQARELSQHFAEIGFLQHRPR